MPVGDMDPEGLQRTLGELLEANRKTQADLDEIRNQFPIQPSNLADAIPDFSGLEEGGLMFWGGGEPEEIPIGEPGEVLEVGEDGKPLWSESCCGGKVGQNLPFNIYVSDLSPSGAETIEIPVADPGVATIVLIAGYTLTSESTPAPQLPYEYGERSVTAGDAQQAYVFREGSAAACVHAKLIPASVENYPEGPTTLTLKRNTAERKEGIFKVVVLTLPNFEAAFEAVAKSEAVNGDNVIDLETLAAPEGLQLAFGHLAAGTEALPTLSHNLIYQEKIEDTDLTAVEGAPGGVAVFSAQFVLTTTATDFVWSFPISGELGLRRGAVGGARSS